MWFNILKLDLSNLQSNLELKPFDKEVSPIKVNNTERCKKKLINFLDKIKKIEIWDGHENKHGSGSHRLQLITEEEACELVEGINKMFKTLKSPKLDKKNHLTLNSNYDEVVTINENSALYFYYVDDGNFRFLIDLSDKDYNQRLYIVGFIFSGTTEQIVEKITEIEKVWEES